MRRNNNRAPLSAKVTPAIKPYALFSILFIVGFLAVFYPLFWHKKAFLWGTDGINQHIQSLRYTREWVLSLSNGATFWNPNLGLGEGVFCNALHPRILNFLYGFFGESFLVPFLVIRAYIYLYLAGLAMVFYLGRIDRGTFARVTGSLMYVTSAFVMYFGARHTFFLEMMIYLPLLCSGIHQILERGRSILFVAVIFAATVSYFYFLLMVSIPTFIYALTLYSVKYKQSDDKQGGLLYYIAITLLHVLLGLLLGSFSLVPQLSAALSSARIGTASFGSLFLWDLRYYVDLVKSILTMREFGIYGHLAISGSALLATVYLAFHHCSVERRVLWYQLLCCAVVLCVPLLSMAYSGFAGKTQRWCFVIAFWLSATVCSTYNDLFEYAGRILRRNECVVTCCVLVCCVVLQALAREYVSVSLIAVLIEVLCLVFFMYRSHAGSANRNVVFMIVCGLLIAHAGASSFELYAVRMLNYVKDFVAADNIARVGKDNAAAPVKELFDDCDIYRTDLEAFSRKELYNQLNYGLADSINGTSSYYSYSSGHIFRFSEQVANSQQENPFLLTGFSQRTVLNELASVKYLAAFDSQKVKLPLGYEFETTGIATLADGSDRTSQIYRNSLALPLVYGYAARLDSTVYNAMEPYDREHSLLHGVLLAGDGDGLPTVTPDCKSEVLCTPDECWKILKSHQGDSYLVGDGWVRTTKKQVKIEIPIAEQIEGELYVYLKGAHYEPMNPLGADSSLTDILKKAIRPGDPAPSATSVVASAQGKSDSVILLSPSQQYYFGPRDSLLCVGYGSNRKSIEVTFSNEGTYTFSELSVVHVAFDDYADATNVLRGFVESVDVAGDTIVCKTKATSNAALVFAIPYSNAWHASMNGEPVDLNMANEMFMAVSIPAGKNEVILKYELPGLKEGLLTSVVTLALLLIIKVYLDTKRKQSASHPL